MKYSEYLLICLAEEAAETSKEALKCVRFGVNDKYDEYDQTNLKRLELEYSDMVATLRDLKSIGISIEVDEARVAEKRKRNLFFADISRERGIIDDTPKL